MGDMVVKTVVVAAHVIKILGLMPRCRRYTNRKAG